MRQFLDALCSAPQKPPKLTVTTDDNLTVPRAEMLKTRMLANDKINEKKLDSSC